MLITYYMFQPFDNNQVYSFMLAALLLPYIDRSLQWVYFVLSV